MFTETLQKAYVQNRPPEVMGKRPLSENFFQTWRNEGLVPAFHCVTDFVQDYGHTETTLKALGIIFGSSILATGLTQYVKTIQADVSIPEYTIPQRAGLALYHASVGMIMAGHSEATDEDSTYAVARDNSTNEPLLLHGQGSMTRKQAEKAIDKGFY